MAQVGNLQPPVASNQEHVDQNVDVKNKGAESGSAHRRPRQLSCCEVYERIDNVLKISLGCMTTDAALLVAKTFFGAPISNYVTFGFAAVSGVTGLWGVWRTFESSQQEFDKREEGKKKA